MIQVRNFTLFWSVQTTKRREREHDHRRSRRGADAEGHDSHYRDRTLLLSATFSLFQLLSGPPLIGRLRAAGPDRLSTPRGYRPIGRDDRRALELSWSAARAERRCRCPTSSEIEKTCSVWTEESRKGPTVPCGRKQQQIRC